MADGQGTRRGAQLLAVALVCLVVFIGAYVLFVLTAWGQSIDDQGLLGRVAALDGGSISLRLLDMIDRGTMVVMVLVLVVIGLARHRRWLAFCSAGGFLAAAVSAEILKRVLPRPDLDPEWSSLLVGKSIDTYPSGSATIATAFVLALIMASRNTIRPIVGLVGSLWCCLIAAGTVAAGWHRPSDAIGGIALATLWIALSAAILARSQGRAARTGPLDRKVPWLAAAVLLVTLTGVVAILVTGGVDRIPADILSWVFPVSQAVIYVAVVLAVGSFTWLLRDVQFGRAPTEETSSPSIVPPDS